MIRGLHFLSCSLVDILLLGPQNGGSNGHGHTVVHPIFSLYFYALHKFSSWCRIVVAVNSPMRVDSRSSMNVLEQVIASFIDGSRCGMSDVAFRSASTIGGLSCFTKHIISPVLHGKLAGVIAGCYH